MYTILWIIGELMVLWLAVIATLLHVLFRRVLGAQQPVCVISREQHDRL